MLAIMNVIKKILAGFVLLLVGFGGGYLASNLARFEIVEKGKVTPQSTTPVNQQTTTGNNNSNSPVVSPNPQPSTPIDSSLTSFKSLNIPSLKQTQQPGPKVRITDGFFRVTGRSSSQTQVNSGIDGLKLLFYDDDLVKSLPSYNPRLGDMIKISGDFAPLVANPPPGYQFVDYYLQSITKVEVIGG
jgi:hypothetical protein